MRFGGPKQFRRLAGRLVVDWALAAARSVAGRVVLVVPPDHEGHSRPEADQVVVGGETRSDSVRAGLEAVPPDAEVVVVHDAARPLASPELFTAVVDAVRDGVDGAVPALPVTDTVKEVDDGLVVRTLDRSVLVTVQTPQAFSAAALRHAHGQQGDATDDAALVEAAGGRVVVVPGEPENLKVNRPADLELAERLVR